MPPSHSVAELKFQPSAVGSQGHCLPTVARPFTRAGLSNESTGWGHELSRELWRWSEQGRQSQEAHGCDWVHR